MQIVVGIQELVFLASVKKVLKEMEFIVALSNQIHALDMYALQTQFVDHKKNLLKIIGTEINAVLIK